MPNRSDSKGLSGIEGDFCHCRAKSILANVSSRRMIAQSQRQQGFKGNQMLHFRLPHEEVLPQGQLPDHDRIPILDCCRRILEGA